MDITAILFLAKFFREGARAATIFFLISYFTLLTTQNWVGYVARLFKICMLFLPILGWYYFPFYKIPIPSGPHQVGYTEFRLNDKHSTLISVFYPTSIKDTKPSRDAIWGDKHLSETWAYAATPKPSFFIKLIFKFLLSYGTKHHMGVHYKAPIL